MSYKSTILNQILQIIPRLEFQNFVNLHKTEKSAKGFSSWTHFVSMIFAQLSGLDNLTSIGGNLTIGGPPPYANTSLTSLTGLENLSHIEGKLQFNNNDALTSLSGLDNLTSVGDALTIYNNDSLASLTGL